MLNCVVYWLYDEQCVCPWLHGYVGVSHAWRKRLKNHQKLRKRDIELKILFEGTAAECRTLEYALRPQRYIGWNINVGGGKNRLGVPHSEVTKQKMSAARRPPMSEAVREKLRIASIGQTNRSRIGQNKTAEERAKIAIAHTGRKFSSEHCAKLGAAKRGNQYRVGARLSPESREQISVKKRGVAIHSKEYKRKLAERWQGNALTKGKPWSAARRLAWLTIKEA